MTRKFLVFVFFIALCRPVLAGEVTVSAGVGLKDVLNDITDAYVMNNPSAKITKNYAPAGILARQLDSGALTDIVLVPNIQWVEYMKEKGHLKGDTIISLAYNTLVFVSKDDHNIKSLGDVVKLNRIAVGSPKSVPAGEYAMEALKGAGIEGQLDKRLVMTRDVRECLLYAERGEVDGAFVYKTDALLSRDVTIRFTVPQRLYPRIIYVSALTVSGAKHKDAVGFFSFLHSPEAKTHLTRHGFEIR